MLIHHFALFRFIVSAHFSFGALSFSYIDLKTLKKKTNLLLLPEPWDPWGGPAHADMGQHEARLCPFLIRLFGAFFGVELCEFFQYFGY